MTKEQAELQQKLDVARTQVKEGQQWYHYKHPELLYTILGVAVIEATEQIAVIYKANYGKHITWIRPIEEFLGEVELNGNMVRRFNLAI